MELSANDELKSTVHGVNYCSVNLPCSVLCSDAAAGFARLATAVAINLGCTSKSSEKVLANQMHRPGLGITQTQYVGGVAHI